MLGCLVISRCVFGAVISIGSLIGWGLYCGCGDCSGINDWICVTASTIRISDRVITVCGSSSCDILAVGVIAGDSINANTCSIRISVSTLSIVI